MKVIYVVSTLKASGPTNQLYNVVAPLVNSGKVEAHIITLSNEEKESRVRDFEQIGISVTCLALGRISSVLFGKGKLRKELSKHRYELIHTQGIRADSLLSKMDSESEVWVSTSHNYPPEDYVMKFGKAKGRIMARNHLKSLSKCKNLISCSTSVGIQLNNHGIRSTAINNGVKINKEFNSFASDSVYHQYQALKILSVGSLIPRKNMKTILTCFHDFDLKHELTILGDGVEYNNIKSFESENIKVLGQVNNVDDYMMKADLFVSSSFSEGLPNTVLEALSYGVPCILSDIPAHRILKRDFSDCILLFDPNNAEHLFKCIDMAINTILKANKSEIILTMNREYSREIMSSKYFKMYQEVCGV